MKSVELKTEVATADFTWAFCVPGGEDGFSVPPSEKRTERGERRGEGRRNERGRGGVLSNSCLH